MKKLVLQTVVVLLCFLPAAAFSQANQFTGSWRGVIVANGMRINDSIIFQPNGQYSQQLTSAVGMTQQSGNYVVNGATLNLTVTDWSPKTQNVYHPTGTVGGNYTPETMAKPPGSTFRFRFNSASSVTLQDANFGGSITLQRVQ